MEERNNSIADGLLPESFLSSSILSLLADVKSEFICSTSLSNSTLLSSTTAMESLLEALSPSCVGRNVLEDLRSNLPLDLDSDAMADRLWLKESGLSELPG